MAWALVETYYKHGEYSLGTFNTDEELQIHLIQNVTQYDKDYDIYALEQMPLGELIELAEDLGNARVQAQSGWGIREVRPIVGWALVETYYKHGEYELKTFHSDAELASYLCENILEHGDREEFDKLDTLTIDDLIELAVDIGNERIKNQQGWGIREVLHM